MKHLIILLCALSVGCEVLPTAKFPDGSMITGGGTIFTKSQSKNVNITHPNGLVMNYNSSGHDETVVPTKVIGSYTTLGLAGYARDAFRTTESTKRVLGAQEVQKTGIQSAERIRTTEILNPTPEEIIPAVAPIATP